MAKVLVTGATGFIGSQLAARLMERGDDVTCLVRVRSNTTRLARLGVRLQLGDVCDPASIRPAVKSVDTVYHLAALVMALHAEDLTAVNGRGSANLLAACARQVTPPTVLMVSSLAAAGPSPADHVRTEADPPRPVSNYGRAKRAGEQAAEAMAGQMPITIVRPPIVFGEGDTAMCPLFRSIFRHGLHMAIGVAHSCFSLIHVSDLVQALIACAERGSRLIDPAQRQVGAAGNGQGYYYAADEERPTFSDLGRMMARSLDRHGVHVVGTDRKAVLWSVAAIAETYAQLRRRPYILSLDKAREAAAGNWTCSPDTIRRELGFLPPVPLSTRLRQTADWYRQERWI